MRNLKLSHKLILLSLILSGFLLLTGWVGWTRLSLLKGNTNEIATRIFARLLHAAEIRSHLFVMIRNQKNAVMTNSDEESKLFADRSEAASTELLNELNRFERDSAGTEFLGKISVLRRNVEGLVTLNTNCLNYAKMNSTVKANTILTKKIMSSLERITDLIEQSEKSEGARSGSSRIELLRVGQQLFGALLVHVNTPSADTGFDTVDKATRTKVDAFINFANNFRDESKTLEVELRNIVALLRPDIDEFLGLSTVDSNERSTKISLTEAKDATDNVLKVLDEIATDARESARKSVESGESVYLTGTYTILVTSIAGLALGCVASFFLSHSITGPVSRVMKMAQEMAKGNLSSRISLNQTDEVGELSSATDSLADALTGIVGQIQKTASDLAGSSKGLSRVAGSLVEQSEQTTTRASSVSSAAEELSANINTISSAAEEISMNFASISSATEEMSVSVGSISSAAEQTSSNVAAVTTAIRDISVSFDQVLGNVREGASIANNASQMANTATATMRDLDHSSSEISKVTETIKMIALQTNLLALNATIEATSAGEAGKGFAVVAHEIKQLANQSAKAAEDIATKIEGVQLGTRQAVGVIQDIAAIIKAINSSADRISSSVEEQNRAAQTIAQNISQANSGVGQIARSIAEVAATANDMSRSIAEATRGSTDVSRNVGEAAKAASGISDSIVQVNKAAQQTNHSSESVTTASESLAELSLELNRLASRFKLPSNGT
ncbi:MAG: methyl-accepting chemotaxis protein [Pirellula sp.]